MIGDRAPGDGDNMKTSTTDSKDSRSTFKRFARIATALAFGGMLCTFPLTSAYAARHNGGHVGGGHVGHGGYRGDYHRGWDHHGWGGYYGGPDYYAAPDYYYDYPEPYAYYPSGPEYGPDYYDAPDGINLFFHL